MHHETPPPSVIMRGLDALAVMSAESRGFARTVGTYAIAGIVALTMACGNVGDQPLPAGTADPTTVANAAGARGMAASTHQSFQVAFIEDMVEGGLLTDELESIDRGFPDRPGQTSNIYLALDSRQLPEETGANLTTSEYSGLHSVRTQAQVAIAALAKYDPDHSARLRGLLYAWQGYAEVMLADLYCSGVPLSHIDFEGDFTYAPSSTTAQVYQHAIVMFDSALALASDSALVAGFASVGKGRALLALGRYADADQAVANVTPDFQYVEPIMSCPSLQGCVSSGQAGLALDGFATVSDVEGANGLPFIRSGDPRTAVLGDPVGTTANGDPVWAPVKYPADYAPDSVIVASGTEAQLIHAEAALQAGQVDTWLQILNTLRSSNPLTSAMPAIVDPGTTTARVDTMFTERAAWLFLTGQRQADLRRLVDVYHRSSQSVYPVGVYPGIGGYGTNIDLPIPGAEYLNPHYHGCLRRD